MSVIDSHLKDDDLLEAEEASKLTYIPDPKKLENTNEAKLMRALNVSSVDELHELSITPEKQRKFYIEALKYKCHN